MIEKAKSFFSSFLIRISDKLFSFYQKSFLFDECAEKCVLIVRVDALGDFFLWLDSAKAISRFYQSQGCKIVLLANAAWADYAKSLKIFDDVLPLNRQSFLGNIFYRWAFLSRLRHTCYVLALNPRFSREYYIDDTILRFCRADKKIGFAGDFSNISPWQKTESDRWYTELIHYYLKSGPFEGFRGKELLSFLEIDGSKIGDTVIACKKMTGYCVVAPGAGWHRRQWPIERFFALVKSFIDRGLICYLCGTKREVPLGENILRLIGENARLRDMTGQTSISEMVELIKNADLTVSNENAVTHISAYYGVPNITIAGGGHFGRFVPYPSGFLANELLPTVVYHQMPCYNCNWNCYDHSQGVVPCIKKIATEDVWQAAEKILSKIKH